MTTDLSATVHVLDYQPIPVSGTSGEIESLVTRALAVEGRTGEWEISIALMSDDELRRLHRDFMGLDSVTDIMTFPLGGDEQGGDIAISIERAAEQAAELGMTAWEEIRFLVVHGVLHLCGWDDQEEESRRAMLARQTEIIDGWRRT